MHALRIALALAALVPTIALAQPATPPRTASLAWMTGTWTEERGEQKVTESWVGPANGLMVAANLTTRGTARKSFEFLRIADTPEGFSYFASPSGRPPVEFKLKEQGVDRVVFENAAHDFPQRIVYWRVGAMMAARIEGKLNGKDVAEQWLFERVR